MNEIIYRYDNFLESDINSIRLVEPVIFKLNDSLHIKESQLYNILICVTEAVNNAIVHGNKNNKQKKVSFTVISSLKELTIIIGDEGDGFVPDKIEDPRKPENLMKSSGRGVFIIRELADFCSIDADRTGTKITMKFLLNK